MHGAPAARLRPATLTETPAEPVERVEALAETRDRAEEAPAQIEEAPVEESSAAATEARRLGMGVAPEKAAAVATAPTPATLRIPTHSIAPLRGSRESLIRQNERTEAEGLERILDADDLNDRIAHKLLVPVPASGALAVNANLPSEYRYCRPWTARFLADMARAHDAVFHRPILVSSAVRTVAYQKQLERINGNAAPAEGDIVSPHLTGGTIDIAKAGLPRSELNWMRAWLQPLEAAGKIDVEEEFLQACFHVTVYATYVPPAPVHKPGVKPRRRRAPVANALAARVM